MKDLFDIELPDNIADWAVGDKNLKEDPLLYYSLAYSLQKRGYDPQFTNYRGVGMGIMRSESDIIPNIMKDFFKYMSLIQ